MISLRRPLLACCIAVSSVAGATADDKKPPLGSIKNQLKPDLTHVVLTPDMVKKLPPLNLSTDPVFQYAEIEYNQADKTYSTTWQMTPADHVRVDEDSSIILRFFESSKVGAKIGTGKIRIDVNSDAKFDPKHTMGYAAIVDVGGQYELSHTFLQDMHKGKNTKLQPGESKQFYIRMVVETPIAKPVPGGATDTDGPPSNILTIITETAPK